MRAIDRGFYACRSCGRLVRQEGKCPRCGARIYAREPFSVQKAWAWLIAGVVFYIPANIQPILVTEEFGEKSSATVIGGVVALVEHGSYGIALVVLVASVVVPIAKFGAVAVILLSVRGKWQMSSHARTELFHLVELIGRWSMIDVFVVAVLAALVQLGTLASVEAGPAAATFAAAVICTMLSALAIDTRLLWDSHE
ncbi:MAG: paraquat-inducible protein A [Myxococcota bacterium]